MTSVAETADAVAAAAVAVPGVVALDGGRFGEIATYAPGRRIAGVRLHDDSGEVHIAVGLIRNVMETAEAVRAAAEAVADRPMTVVVQDVVLPDEAVPGDGTDART